MENQASGRMRRSSQAQPRNQALTVKLSAAEKDKVRSAAAQRHLAAGAYVAEVALAAAEGRTVPVHDTEREMLGELMQIRVLLSWCRADLFEAAGRAEAAGLPVPDLDPVAAQCKEAAARAEAAAIRLSRTLPGRHR